MVPLKLKSVRGLQNLPLMSACIVIVAVRVVIVLSVYSQLRHQNHTIAHVVNNRWHCVRVVSDNADILSTYLTAMRTPCQHSQWLHDHTCFANIFAKSRHTPFKGYPRWGMLTLFWQFSWISCQKFFVLVLEEGEGKSGSRQRGELLMYIW